MGFLFGNNKIQRRIGACLLSIAVMLLDGRVCLPTFAQSPQVLGGATIPDDLRITISANGAVVIEQYDGSAFVQQTSISTFASGSFVRSSLGPCSFGYSSPGSNTIVPISNTISPDNTIVTTIARCDASTLPLYEFKQDVFYLSGTNRIFYSWEIKNVSTNPANLLKFFHVQEANIDNTTSARGFANNLGATLGDSVGARQEFSTFAKGLLLRAFAPPPTHYESASSTLMLSLVTTADLTDSADTTGGSPKAFGFQWDAPVTLNPSESIQFAASEGIFRSNIRGGSYIIPPPEFVIDSSAFGIFPFFLVNTSGNNLTYTLSTAIDPGWTSNISGPSVLTVPAVSEDFFFVNAAPPLDAQAGDSAVMTVSADDGISSPPADSQLDVELLEPLAVTPTPSPTPSPSSTVAPSPTAIPAEVKVTFDYPYSSTGTLTPTLSGAAFPGSVVQIIVDGVLVGTTQSNASGLWLFKLSNALTFGSHQVQVSATDPFARTSSLPSAVNLFATGGADLDFEGDGYAELASYVTLGGNVIYRFRNSSDGSSQVASAKGVVPAPADYDGDGRSDFAAIRRSGKSFIWSATVSSTNTLIENTFGTRGDTLLTGCSFNSDGRAALALIRKSDLVFTDLINSPARTASNIISGTVLGCADMDSDHVDEIILAGGGSPSVISSVKLDGTRKVILSVPQFTKGLVGRKPNSDQKYLLTVRSQGPNKRILDGVSLLSLQSSDKFEVPRKVIFSGGSFSFNGVPKATLLYQDIKSGKVFRQFEDDPSGLQRVATFSKTARLLLSQYLYPTR